MQVILKERVPKLGQAWDVVNVKPGFARNYLFTQNLAMPATKQGLEKVEQMKANRVAKAEAIIENAKEIADKLKKVVLTFTKKAQGEKLYGALGEKEIIEALLEEAKVELKPSMIETKEPIKTTGEHEIQIKLTDEIQSTIKVIVEAEA